MYQVNLLTHVANPQLSAVVPRPPDPALPQVSPSCLAPAPSRPGGARSALLPVAWRSLFQPCFIAIVSCRALVIKLVQRSLASSLARATARQQCLLRKESVISGRYLVSKFIDFSYTVPLQRRTSGITRLSPYVPPYLRILPLNALHTFASTAS
ncbi:Hypothetical_protein [Hexamita inflata]|uniref:Hypothetical_protein n=1 Tax=Hexamita inflata TaxID=28002 RepID=A0AA86TN55_9EUKA|nr:Hypothetical protein HINF_LOCUS10020 [Hexamita inflata]